MSSTRLSTIFNRFVPKLRPGTPPSLVKTARCDRASGAANHKSPTLRLASASPQILHEASRDIAASLRQLATRATLRL
eukprot:15480546-Alexandrium_andersonii.AAC.1